MSATAIIVIAVVAVGMIVDWLIVMGTDPRKWKGGRKP